MEEDGFTLVKRRGSDRQNKQKNALVEAHSSIAGSSGSSNKLSIPPRVDASVDDIAMTMRRVGEEIKQTQTVKWLKLRLERILDGRKLEKIFVIGNGHFDSSFECGTYQLATCLNLKEHFRTHVVFQEPVCSANERVWLEANQLEQRVADDLLVETSSDSSCILVVLIHGIAALMNDVLKINWKPEKLKRLILICNDYNSDASTLTTCGSGHLETNDTSKYAALRAFCRIASFEKLPELEKRRNSFACTALAHWNGDDDNQLPEIR